jgi:hypothetical protein
VRSAFLCAKTRPRAVGPHFNGLPGPHAARTQRNSRVPPASVPAAVLTRSVNGRRITAVPAGVRNLRTGDPRGHERSALWSAPPSVIAGVVLCVRFVKAILTAGLFMPKRWMTASRAAMRRPRFVTSSGESLLTDPAGCTRMPRIRCCQRAGLVVFCRRVGGGNRSTGEADA